MLFLGCLLNILVTWKMDLKDRSSLTIPRAPTLRWKLQSKLDISPSYRILTLGQPALALTLQRQTLGMGASRVPVLNSFLMVTGKFSIVIRILLHVFGSRERHSEPTKEMCIPLRPIPKEDTWSLKFLKAGQLAETGRPNNLIHGR